MSIDLSEYKIDADSSEKVTTDDFNYLIDAVQNALNNIENDQIPDDEIALVKVEGGAVPESDVSSTGEVNKIVQLDASGNLTIANGGSIKVILT